MFGARDAMSRWLAFSDAAYFFILLTVLVRHVEALNFARAPSRGNLSQPVADLHIETIAAVERLPDNLKDLKKREAEASDSLLRSYGFEHILRVCNAYADSNGLEAFLTSQRLTINPVPYSHCEQYGPRLKIGDEIIFKIGLINGTFTLSRLPTVGSVMLMIISRHETENNILAFHSHVFKDLKTPQLAIVDAYKGRVPSQLRKEDSEIYIQAVSPTGVREEVFKYNTVAVVNPGTYKLQLRGDEGNLTAVTELVAVARGCYAVIRIGVADTMYTPGLLIYPHTDKKLLGAATRTHGAAAVRMALLLVLASFLRA